MQVVRVSTTCHLLESGFDTARNPPGSQGLGQSQVQTITAELGGPGEEAGAPCPVISRMTFPGKSQGKAVSVLLSQAVGWLLVQLAPHRLGLH